MQCQPCGKAATDPRRDDFSDGCMSCKARALACIGAHLESKAAGRRTAQYTEVLREVFGADAEAGAAEVKRWAGMTDRR